MLCVMCNSCNRLLDLQSFTKNQLKKKREPRCKECVQEEVLGKIKGENKSWEIMQVQAGETDMWPHHSFKPKTAVFSLRDDRYDKYKEESPQSQGSISVLVAKKGQKERRKPPNKRPMGRGPYTQNNLFRSTYNQHQAPQTFHNNGRGQTSTLHMPVQNHGALNSTNINVPVNISVDNHAKSTPFGYPEAGRRAESKSQQLHFVNASATVRSNSPASSGGENPVVNVEVPLNQFSREFFNSSATAGESGQILYNSGDNAVSVNVNACAFPNVKSSAFSSDTKGSSSNPVSFSSSLFNQTATSSTYQTAPSSSASIKSYRSDSNSVPAPFTATPTNMVPVIAQIPIVNTNNTVENARVLEGVPHTGAVGANTTGSPDATVKFLEWADGSKYYGYVLNSKRCGKGVFVWPEGILYDGHWKDGVMHGEGTLLLDGKFYFGEFQNGKYNGEGIFTWHDGSIYEGEWKNGRPHGYGSYQCARGGKFIGDWRYGTQYGSGTCLYPNGIMYAGDFKNNLRHGRGTCQWPNGSYYSGQWDNNEMRKPQELKIGISL